MSNPLPTPDTTRPASMPTCTGPQSFSKQHGLFGWVHSLGSPPATSVGPLGSPPKSGFASASAGASTASAGASAGGVGRFAFTRPRKDSSSLSHDEALNISRAGWNAPAEPAPSVTSAQDGLATPGEFDIPQPAGTAGLSNNLAHTGAAGSHRRRSSSRYNQLGLMAAYSGGPQSF